MSDWGAVVDKVDSVRGGLDLEMPGPGRRNEAVIAAVERSELSMEEIDDHVRRFLTLVDTALRHKRPVDSVVFVGTTDRVECEGYDRGDLQLPAAHVALLNAVTEVTDQVVVVNMSGSAADLGPVAERARAILHCWLGQQGIGLALARVLFGEEDPGGRLTETFPLEVEHNPSFLPFPGTIDSVEYREGLFVGYRFHDARNIPVAYPLGYGLSYTSFSYDRLSVEESSSEGGRREYDVHATVRNTGSRRGTEVVQIYVRDVESFQPRPVRELKGFARVSLGPGESATVTIHLDWRAFATYVVHLGSFAVEAGEFVIEAGLSSRCIRLSRAVSVDSPDEVHAALTPDHDLRTYLSDDHSSATVAAAYELVAESCGHHQILDSLAGMPIRLVFSVLPMAGASKESIRALQDAVEAVRRR